MNNELNLEQFKRMFPHTDADWLERLMGAMNRFNINNARRVSAFLANCSIESSDFNVLVENLNYSVSGLMKTWPKRFPTVDFAMQYAHNPKKIANFVYGGRMGNGGPETNDGWNYRGRGIIQITGKDEYIECSKGLFGNDILVNQFDLLTEPTFAAYSAAWFWNWKNINEPADAGDLQKVTKLINGSLTAHEQRVKAYNRLLPIVKETYVP